METKPQSRWRLCWMALGWTLIVLSPFAGPIPGPTGIPLFAAGVALLVRNSTWAKRRYVGLKRRWPKLGRLTDQALRRGKTAASAID